MEDVTVASSHLGVRRRQFFVNNFGFFILLAWMPKYFNDVVKLNLATSSWFSALPWATMAVSGVFASILADRNAFRVESLHGDHSQVRFNPSAF